MMIRPKIWPEQQAYDEIMNNKLGTFHEAFTLFPTGIAAAASRDKVYDQILKGKGLRADLDAMVKACETVESPAPQKFSFDLREPVLPQHPTMATVLGWQSNIMSNSSKRFQFEHHEEFKLVEKFQEDYAHAAATAITQTFGKSMDAVCSPLSALLARKLATVAPDDDLIREKLEDIVSNLGTIAALPWAKVLPQSRVQVVSAQSSECSDFVKQLSVLIQQVRSGKLDICPEGVVPVMKVAADRKRLEDIGLSDAFCKLMIGLRETLVVVAKEHLSSTLESFSPFIVKLADTDASADSPLDQKLTGSVQDTDDDSPFDWPYLSSTSWAMLKNMVPTLLPGERMLPLKFEDKVVEINIEFCCIAYKFLRFGIHAATMKDSSHDTDTEVAALTGAVQKRWGAVLPAYRDLAKCCANLPEGKMSKRAEAVLAVGKAIFVKYTQTMFDDMLIKLDDILSKLEDAAEDKRVLAVMDLIKNGDEKFLEGDSPAQLMKIVDSSEAAELFDSFHAMTTQVGAVEACLKAMRGILHTTGTSGDFKDFADYLDGFGKQLDEKNSVWKAIKECAGKVLGNLTVCQALLRPLSPGEARASLLRKCARGIQSSPYLTCEARLESLFPKLEKRS